MLATPAMLSKQMTTQTFMTPPRVHVPSRLAWPACAVAPERVQAAALVVRVSIGQAPRALTAEIALLDAVIADLLAHHDDYHALQALARC